MNLKQLRSFLVVAREHQITAAAKLLYTSQPPLSYQMKQLEKEIGATLFQRTAHGIELTTAGITFQRYAKQMVALADDAQDELSQEQDGTSGTIKMGIISSAGIAILQSQLGQLSKFYPHLKFSISEGNTFTLVKQLKSQLIDVAIVRSPLNMVGLKQEALMDDQMVAVFDRSHYQLPKRVLKLQDLISQPLIIYRRFEALFNESFSRAGWEVNYTLKCDDARTAVLTADAGLGVAIVPASIAKLYAKTSYQRINYSKWQTKILVVWPNNQPTSPLTQRCINALKNMKTND